MLAWWIVLALCVLLSNGSELPSWHMKPIGSHIPPEKVDESFADDIISPHTFAENYVIPRKPIVFRNVVKKWPAFKLWTDDYLKNNYGDLEMRIEGKKEKGSSIPKGDVCLGRDRLRTFLNEYQTGADKYVVSELPTPMWKDVFVPPPMGCGEFLRSYVEIDLWINSDLGKKGQGGNSILHKDAFNTVNCVVNGSKDWKLIELQYNDYVYQSWEGPMDAGYGGFSLVNPDKVDAKEFPDFGKIPRWQFVKVNAGDCLYLPSQMWHQVKSYGETNKAVAFLFSQFSGRQNISTSTCLQKIPAIPLSDVDVDLQYPGYGLMTMGHFELSAVQKMLKRIIDKKGNVATKRRVYKLVKETHDSGGAPSSVILRKAKELYEYLLKEAGGVSNSITSKFISTISRNQTRVMLKWLFPIEPASSYDHEYSFFLPEDIINIIEQLMENNGGELEKIQFINSYEKEGGTLKFAEDFWKKLGGEKDVISDVTGTLEAALLPYEEHRRENPEMEEEDDEATLLTPQGHVSQPKRRKGGYSTETAEKSEENKNVENTKIRENIINSGSKKTEL